MRSISIAILACILMAQSCSDDEFTVLEGTILEIDAPPKASPDAGVHLHVTFSGGTNGCAKAERLDVKSSKNVHTVKAFYRKPNDPKVICNMAMPVHELEVVVQMHKSESNYIVNEKGDTLATIALQPIEHE